VQQAIRNALTGESAAFSVNSAIEEDGTRMEVRKKQDGGFRARQELRHAMSGSEI
jgi:hypothetical protein